MRAPKMTFEAWMAEVDHAVGALAGVSAFDLPDYPYRDAYDGGKSARAVAAKAVKAAKEDF